MGNAKNRRFDLDLVRFVAMLLVIMFHVCVELNTRAFNGVPPLYWAGANTTFGQLGVSLFFITSGITSAKSFARDEGQPLLRRTLRYYKKRWLSLMPLFYLAYLMFYKLCSFVLLPKDPAFLWTILGMDGYLSISGVSTYYICGEWFLGAIILLYLFFPFLYTAITKAPRISAVVLTVWFVAITVWYPFRSMRAPDADVLLRIFDLALGIYAAKYLREMNIIGLFIGLCLFLIGTLIPLPATLFALAIPVQGFGAMLVLIFLGQKLGKVSNAAGNKHSIGELVLSMGLGAISFMAQLGYAIYLVHHVILNRLIDHFYTHDIGILRFLLITVLTLIASIILGMMLSGGWQMIQTGFKKSNDKYRKYFKKNSETT